jgi:hypothetical protein
MTSKAKQSRKFFGAAKAHGVHRHVEQKRKECFPVIEAGVVLGCKCGWKARRGDSWVIHANRREAGR